MRRTAPLLVLVVMLAASAADAAPIDETQITAIASQLRCVVCQNLSVADSPSEMARQMRELIRERLAQGDTPEQVMAYFVDRYGEWVRLSPRFGGFTLVAWVLPFLGLGVGLGAVFVLARRWARRSVETPSPLTPEDRERVRVELDRLP